MLELHFLRVTLFSTPFADLNLHIHRTWGKMWYIVWNVNRVPRFILVRLSNGFHLADISTNMLSRTKTQTNGIAQHVAKTKHEINWENTIFLDSEMHWRRRKIKEALYIDSLNPGKQISNNIMNLEKGFDLSGCCKEFGPEIRKKLSSKIPIIKQLLSVSGWIAISCCVFSFCHLPVWIV